ncbi:hypothetical protein ALC62_14499, partial [Cyphomyrmex costatus]
ADFITITGCGNSRTRLHCQPLPSPPPLPPPPPRELMTKVMFQVARKIPKILAR